MRTNAHFMRWKLPERSGESENGERLRLAGELVEDDRREARQSMLDAYPSLQKMYSADDGNTEVFYFKNATATFSSFTHEPEVVKF